MNFNLIISRVYAKYGMFGLKLIVKVVPTMDFSKLGKGIV